MDRLIKSLVFLLLFCCPAHAALDVEVGNVATATSTGTQEVNLSGAFQPDIVIFFSNIISSGSTSSSTDSGITVFGAMKDADERFSISIQCQDNVSASNCGRSFDSDEAITVVAASGSGYAGEADFSSMDSDGFTVNWATAMGTARELNYIAIRGDNLDVAIGTFNSPNTAPNDVSVSGLGFDPDVVIISSSILGTTEGASTAASFSVGVATGASSEWGIYHVSGDNNNPTNTARYQSQTYSALFHNLVSLTEYGDLKSLDTGGFTYQFSAVHGASGKIYSYIAIGGVTAEVGNHTEPASTGTKETNLTGAFQPELLLFGHIANSTEDSIVDHQFSGMGAASSTSDEHSYSMIHWDNQSPSNVELGHSEGTNVITGYYSSALNFSATVNSFDSDGFTLNWTARNSSRNNYYLALKEEAAAAVASKVSQVVVV